jgi:hypothetical protein
MFVTFIFMHLAIIGVVLLWRTYETHPGLPLNPGVTEVVSEQMLTVG